MGLKNNISGSSFDGVAVTDELGRLEFSNDSFFEIIGLPGEELIDKCFMEVIPEDMRDLLERWRQTGTDMLYETKIMARNGEEKNLYISCARAEFDGTKKYVITIKDISEQKKLESNLRESEARYRELFENADDTMYTFDSKGFFQTINNAGRKALGATLDEIIGSHGSKWIAPDSRKVANERFMKLISGVSLDETAIYEIVCRNGEHKWAELRTRPIKEGAKIIGIHGIARDITEKKRLEEQLKESEAKYRDLFENADDPMFTLDPEGNFIELNDTGLNLLGCIKNEVIGSNISRWMTPESDVNARKAMKKRINGEQVDLPTILEMVSKNGEHRWVEVKSRILKDGNRIKGLHGIARDITEKRRMEQKLIKYHEILKKNEEKYKDLFENAYDPMYTLDLHGNFQKINNAGLKVLGGTLEETIGSHISRWLTPQSYKEATERLKNIASDIQVSESIVYELVLKNGEHRWAEIRNRAIKERGKITGFHGIARDVTEKIKLEKQLKEFNQKLERSYEELKESESKYFELFENANDGIYTHDTEGHFLTVNNAGLKILGCATKDEVIGSNISRWLTPESFEIARKIIMKYLSGEPVNQPIILEIIRKNDEHRFLEFRNRIIRDNDRIIAIHGIARDVTEKRKMEQQLKEYHGKLQKSYEELKEADRLKTEFISNITHELLTPLTSIKGFVELLNDETIGKINDEQKKSLDIVLRNSDRLIQLIKELLDAAYFEQNKFNLKFGMVSINNIISKSLQDMHPQANEKKITIIQDIKPLPEIWADEEKIIQVLSNLLSNAIKFTPQNGMISVTAIDDTNHIKISITDTGIGIPPDKLSRIFDRFYQIDGSTSRKYGGMGIGLSICKSIIEGHYGSIWAESNGNGSTFNVTLPKLIKKKRRIKEHNVKS